jgi:hypothetical protein
MIPYVFRDQTFISFFGILPDMLETIFNMIRAHLVIDNLAARPPLSLSVRFSLHNLRPVLIYLDDTRMLLMHFSQSIFAGNHGGDEQFAYKRAIQSHIGGIRTPANETSRHWTRRHGK